MVDHQNVAAIMGIRLQLKVFNVSNARNHASHYTEFAYQIKDQFTQIETQDKDHEEIMDEPTNCCLHKVGIDYIQPQKQMAQSSQKR